MRLEHDSLGDLEVPAQAYYGIQTQRAVQNFPISGWTLPNELVVACATLKLAAAQAHLDMGHLAPEIARAIILAAQEIRDGHLADQFVVDAFQAGAGTSFHMNVNEVIASRASELLGGQRGDRSRIHPNDHVNMGQSTNDVFPTAMRLACLALTDPLVQGLEHLAEAFAEKAHQFDSVIKSGRTHLQDAVPLRLGQEFGAYARCIARGHQQVRGARASLLQLGIGGTAVGTGLNTAPGYRERVVAHLRTLTGRELVSDPDLFCAMQSMGPFTELSAILRNLALELIRIANDVRLLASGPRTGLGELTLPAVQPGSSIMPGKINPSIPEMVDMVGFQVVGCDAAIAMAAQAGQLELNVMMPVIAFNLLMALRLLTSSVQILQTRCIDGITANIEVCRAYAERSLGLATVLNPAVGYAQAAEVAKTAHAHDRTVTEVVQERALLPDAQLTALFSPERLTSPNLDG